MNVLGKQKQSFSWAYNNKTNEEINKIITNFANGRNVYVVDLVINDGTATFTTYSKIGYEDLVNELIAERYTIQDELAIQRKHQKGVNQEEFNEYYEFVEQCKVRAKTFIAERERVTNG